MVHFTFFCQSSAVGTSFRVALKHHQKVQRQEEVGALPGTEQCPRNMGGSEADVSPQPRGGRMLKLIQLCFTTLPRILLCSEAYY